MKDLLFELNYIIFILMQIKFNSIEQKAELISTLQKVLSNLEQLA